VALARLLRVLLESDGYSVSVAHNGAEALVLVGNAVPDIILLDLQMPVMDGRTFYREFRALGLTTPIILLSAYNPEAAQDELGANGALRKPFEPLTVLAEVKKHIGSEAKTTNTGSS